MFSGNLSIHKKLTKKLHSVVFIKVIFTHLSHPHNFYVAVILKDHFGILKIIHSELDFKWYNIVHQNVKCNAAILLKVSKIDNNLLNWLNLIFYRVTETSPTAKFT